MIDRALYTRWHSISISGPRLSGYGRARSVVMMDQGNSRSLSVCHEDRGLLMAIHDWTRVEAGVFHHFHLSWIDAIARALNAGMLPADYYALAEQHAAGIEPDVLTLHAERPGADNGDAVNSRRSSDAAHGAALLAPPKPRIIAQADMEFYRRKQNTVTVRHVSGDRTVAVVEIVSPGNKSTRNAVDQIVKKAAEFLEPGGCVVVPMEATYETAWEAMPHRWRDVLSREIA